MKYLNKIYGNENFLEQVSPEFKKYVYCDLAQNRFLIRDMLTENILVKVPPYIMSVR